LERNQAQGWTDQVRRNTQQELEKASGHLSGLAEVLQAEFPPSIQFKFSKLTYGVVAAAGSAVLAGAASAAENIPVVGPTVSSWLKPDSN
jgi:hypothetical protein